MIKRRSGAIGLVLLGGLAILGMASPGVRAENITITRGGRPGRTMTAVRPSSMNTSRPSRPGIRM